MTQSRQLLLGIIVLVLLAGGWWWRSREVQAPAPEYHVHAIFIVYRDNVKLDFSGVQYMHIKPCTEDEVEETLTPAEEQQDRAHMHDNIGDVVHVHRRGADWQDLLTNISFDFNAPVTGYRNGQPVSAILQTEIRENDRVLILVGNNTDIETKLQALPSLEYLQDSIAKGESC